MSLIEISIISVENMETATWFTDETSGDSVDDDEAGETSFAAGFGSGKGGGRS